MADPQTAVQTLRSRLEQNERGGSDRDRETLLAFSDELKLLRESYGWHRHEKLLRHCVRISEETSVDIAATLDDRDATETVVSWIHDTYDLDETPETNQNYRVALRVFGRRVTDDGVGGDPNEPPASIDWVKSTLPTDYDPSPDPAQMLGWESDVEPMLDATMNSRDAAAIALQFDAGLRGGELFDLRVSDLSDTEHGMAVRVDGKTGQRSVDLIPSTPHVNRWLTDHPGGGGDYLWTHLRTPERLSYQYYLDMFKEPASRADVDKPVTPTNFRKSNLAWLARQGMNARYIEKRQGRVAGSEAVARYVGIFDADVGDEYARLMGLEVADDDGSDELAPVVCPRCDKETPRDEQRCVWCGHAVSHEAAQRDVGQNVSILDELADLDGDQAADLAEVAKLLEQNPWLRSVVENR
jgi:site-specific recombinase XerD